MDVTDYAFSQIILQNWHSISVEKIDKKQNKLPKKRLVFTKINPLLTLKNWLNSIEINDPHLAHRLCKLIPVQCPFQREIKIFGHKILTIPPLCKLNPVYDELMSLRFRAICYLADECGEDVSNFC